MYHQLIICTGFRGFEISTLWCVQAPPAIGVYLSPTLINCYKKKALSVLIRVISGCTDFQREDKKYQPTLQCLTQDSGCVRPRTKLIMRSHYVVSDNSHGSLLPDTRPFRAKLLSRSDVLYSRSVPRHWSKKRRLLEKLLPPRREVFFYFIILFLVSSVWLFCFCVYLTLLTQSLLNF